jgi:hypothetical protein
MKVLLSIKPQFVEEIMQGRKTFEFRKAVPKQEVSSIVVYSSSPVCRIVGEIEVEQILCHHPSDLWQATHQGAGISRHYFETYFRGRNKAYAIQIKKFRPYSRPIPLREKYPDATPPQSFCYVS